MDELLAAARSQRLPIVDDPMATPVDLAIDIWLAAPELVRSRHAEAIAMRQQNFEYFGPQHPVRGAFPDVDAVLRVQIEAELPMTAIPDSVAYSTPPRRVATSAGRH